MSSPASTNTVDRDKARKQQTLILVAMCLVLGMAALDDTVVNVALPSLQTNLAMSVSGLQWIQNAYLLPIACLVLPAGNLGDIYGRRKVFLAGLGSFIVASMLVGIATGSQMAIAGRLLQGIGAAALLPGSLAILSDAYPDKKERTKAIGIWSGVSGLALIVGPALGGFLVDTLGWRSIFYLNLPLGMLTVWLTIRVVPLGKTPRQYQHQPQNSQRLSLPRRLDLPGMLLSVITLASFVVLLMGFDGITAQSLFLFCLTCGSAIAFVFVESTSTRPMLPLKLLQQPTFVAVFITNALLLFMLVSLMFLFSLFLQQVQGYSAAETGLRFLPLNAAFIVASLISGYLSARIGWRYAITAGFLLTGCAVLGLTQVQADTPFNRILFQLVLVGFGVGFTLSPLTAAGMGCASSVPGISRPSGSSSTRGAGITAALMNTSTRLGGALGIAVQGRLFSQGMKAHLAKSLAEIGLSQEDRVAILAEALDHGATRSAQLMSLLPIRNNLISLGGLESAIQDAFVSGLSNTLWMGAIALLIAAGLSWTFVRSPSKLPQ
ncbi:MAG: MFS transporter [Cyanobacteria bacterium J06627_28]